MNHNMNNNNNNIDFIIILMNNDSGKPIFSTKIDTNHNNVNHNKNNTNNSSKRTNHDDNNIHDNSKASSTSSLLDGDDNNNNNNNNNDDSSHMICSILQTIQNFILYNINTSATTTTNGGIIQSIHTNQMILCFMTIQSITFIAISINHNNHNNHNNQNQNHNTTTIESFLRIRIEYIYLYLIFNLTDSIFISNNNSFISSSFHIDNDIQKLLLHNCNTLLPWSYSTTTTNDRNNNDNNTIITIPSLLTGGIPIYTPLIPSIRNSISLLLQQISNTIPNTFAILLYNSNIQLISIVQSSYILHQIQNSDLLLLSSILHKYKNNSNNNNSTNTNNSTNHNETGAIWVPICLSRLHSSRYVYVYIHCFLQHVVGTATQLLYICMISTIGTTEQFHLFHTATIQQLIPSLILPSSLSNIQKDHVNASTTSNVEKNTINNNNTNNDCNTNTATNVDPIVHNNDDYNNNNNNNINNDDEDEYELITHDDTVDTINPCHLLLSELIMNSSSSSSPHNQNQYLFKYLKSGIIQFVLRVDIPISINSKNRKNIKNNNNSNESIGHLIQCISSPMNNNSMTTPKLNEHQLWNMYQQLQKRLRIESADVDSLADNIISNSNTKTKNTTSSSSSLLSSSVLQHCTTILFIESIPSMEGVTYITNGSITYFGMNGRGFELYYCAETSLSIDHITTLGATLIRQLLADIDTLFISQPLTID